MKKRSLLCTAAVICIMAMVFALPVAAEENSGACGENVMWQFDESSATLTISGSGIMDDYERYDPYDDTAIAPPWSKFKIQKVIIEEGVLSIGDNAFAGMEIEEFQLCDSIRTIGEYAFSENFGLQSINFPGQLETIEQHAFWMTVVHSVTFPDTLKNVEYGAFLYSEVEKIYCSDLKAWCHIEFAGYGNPMQSSNAELYIDGKLLTDLVIPDGITVIGEETFSNYAHLRSVFIPEGVTEIDDCAFGLNVNWYGMVESQIEQIVIPHTVQRIGDQAFWRMASLDRLVILNPECEISEGCYYWGPFSEDTMEEELAYADLVVYGYASSTAQAFAKEMGLQFVELVELEAVSSEKTWLLESGDMVITVEEPYENFHSIIFDGETLATDHYSVASGSTVVTIEAAYLAGVPQGEHTIKVVFLTGEASFPFVIGNNEQVGDLPTEPAETEPSETEPEQTDPAVTDPTEPAETDPEVTDPTEPSVTEPEETDPAVPETAAPPSGKEEKPDDDSASWVLPVVCCVIVAAAAGAAVAVARKKKKA